MMRKTQEEHMIIRDEGPNDYPAVHTVNASAFETPAEATLVEVLRKEAYPVISLVAEENGAVMGHIMFSPVTLSDHADLKIMGLGPMAVLPTHQGRGIGTALVKTGQEKCGNLGFGAVVVLGHTWFYPRFGFTPSARYGIRCEYDVPEDVFMVLELQPGFLQGVSGMIKYHAAFNDI
jgi:putative acetyltransferase